MVMMAADLEIVMASQNKAFESLIPLHEMMLINRENGQLENLLNIMNMIIIDQWI
jgi:hypothetical protein